MKKYLYIFTILSIIGFSKTIDYNRLHDSKKYVMKLNDKQKDFLIDSLFYEINTFGNINTEKSGENYINHLEDKKQNLLVENRTYTIGDKNKIFVLTKFNISKKIPVYGNIARAGLILGYSHLKHMNDKTNGMSLGINLSFKLSDLNLLFLTQHEVNYHHMEYEKKFTGEYIGISGVASIKALLGSSFFIEPSLNAGYVVNFRSKTLDMNNDLIVMNPSINFLVGGSAKLGYMFGTETKVKIYAEYSVNKRLKNKNEYEIYDRQVIKSEDNYLTHGFSAGADINIKNSHNIILNFGRDISAYKGGLSYRFNW